MTKFSWNLQMEPTLSTTRYTAAIPLLPHRQKSGPLTLGPSAIIMTRNSPALSQSGVAAEAASTRAPAPAIPPAAYS
jgi:hypothetical protein